ncbi:MAG: di-trans,poly-cis-decaprenylcistransferase [Clostridia bacterium]|nr:di-trans,poly-cis-decaprenylcistransferase [Clostridia bacterium]
MSDFSKSATPNSVAIIMDGNGRWATQRSLDRCEGHIAGARAISAVLRALFEKEVHFVTLYAFSTENWKRPRAEVSAIMSLIYRYLNDTVIPEIKSDARLSIRFIGDLTPLDKELRESCEYAEKISRGGEYTCAVALNYGGRAEILHAVNEAIREGATAIDEQTLSRHLYTRAMPDPDLIIRTGGELRTSNFLIWQSAYSEYVILDKLWPDITPEDIISSLDEYTHRKRRYGGL